jgi:hypothetical protein
MRPALLPEIRFDFREVIEVVPAVHFGGLRADSSMDYFSEGISA